jgi:hypothetical protein
LLLIPGLPVEKSTSQAASSHRAECLQWVPIIVRKIGIPRKIGTNLTNVLLIGTVRTRLLHDVGLRSLSNGQTAP